MEVCREDILAAYQCLYNTYRKGGKLLLCGNGGSAADCDHIVGELMKAFRIPRTISSVHQEGLGELSDKLQGALPAISLSAHNALILAVANDTDPTMVFAQQVYGYGTTNDSLLCISTSGNSANIVNAAIVASKLGLTTLAMTGSSSSRLSACCDVSIQVPATATAEVQEYHLPIYHALCAMLESEFFST